MLSIIDSSLLLKKSNDVLLENVTYSEEESVHLRVANLLQTGNLTNLSKLKVSAKVNSICNINLCDRLINVQAENIIVSH